MKLWRVENGWLANGVIHVLVISETEDGAKRIASASFRDEDPRESYSAIAKLKAEILCEDTSAEWASRVSD